MKKIIALLLTVMLLVPTFALTATAQEELPHYNIGVVIHTTTDFLCSKYKAYSEYIGKNFNVDFTYYILSSFDDDVYLAAIETLCGQGMDAIITTNFSGSTILKGIKICEDNGVYMAVGWSHVEPGDLEQAKASPYFVGSSYEDDYNAGYALVKSCYDAGKRNILAIGYVPGITCHDQRWNGMMKAFEDLGIKPAGEYRGLEFSDAVESYLAMDTSIDAICITLMGLEYTKQPIANVGKTGEITVACVDFSDTTGEALADGDLSLTIGGQYVDVAYSFILLYNALRGTPLASEPVEVPVNFISAYNAQEFDDYMTYVHNDIFAYTADEIKSMIKVFNPDASADQLLKMGATFSIEDCKTRHADLMK